MRSIVRPALLVLAVAVAVRVAAAAVLGIDGPAVGDERGYALLAESLARGGGLRLPLPPDVVAAAGGGVSPLRSFRAPGLPLALAPVAALGGGLVAMRVLCLALGALTAPLLLVALRRTTSPRATFLAALAYAAWPPAIHVSLRALSEPLCLLLLLAAVPLVRSRPWLAGAASGLAVLTRPAALLPAAGMALAAGGRRRVLVVLLGLAAVVTPWIVRTAVLHGRPLLTTNSGATLVGGNSPAAAAARPPGKWLPPAEVYTALPDPPDLGIWGWSRLGEAGSDARFTRDALAWVRAEPLDAALLVGAKLLRIVDPDPHSRQADAARKRWIGWLTLPPVLLLALLALVCRRRLGRSEGMLGWGPWIGLAAGTCVTVAIFYGDARMRSTADPALLAAAGAGLDLLLPRRDPGDPQRPPGP